MKDQAPLDDLLNISAAFDWLTPTWAILQDFANRPAVHFGVAAYAGFDRGDIRRRLRKRGCKSWGYLYNVAGDLIMFSVPKSQAALAYQVMQSEGLPVLYAPVEATGEAKKRGALGRLLGW